MWRVRPHFSVKHFPQPGNWHLNGFSPVWERIWRVSPHCDSKSLPQPEKVHWNILDFLLFGSTSRFCCELPLSSCASNCCEKGGIDVGGSCDKFGRSVGTMIFPFALSYAPGTAREGGIPTIPVTGIGTFADSSVLTYSDEKS